MRIKKKNKTTEIMLRAARQALKAEKAKTWKLDHMSKWDFQQRQEILKLKQDLKNSQDEL